MSDAELEALLDRSSMLAEQVWGKCGMSVQVRGAAELEALLDCSSMLAELVYAGKV